MYYSYLEIEYVATSFSPARTDLALKLLNIHSDASYLSEAKARSRACGHFFMGWMPQNGEPIQLNGAFHLSTTIMHFVVASVAEAELGALYHNCQMGIII
jgi:hypothetical protein